MSGHINLILFFSSHSCIIFHSYGCNSLVIQEKILNITAAFVLEQEDTAKQMNGLGTMRNQAPFALDIFLELLFQGPSAKGWLCRSLVSPLFPLQLKPLVISPMHSM